jgi:hypothetical protein
MRSTSRIYVSDILDEGFVHVMEHAGFKASLMKAPMLKDTGKAHGLPPGEKLPVVPIANLPGCPESWSREAGTYVCPIDVGWSLWFDFTMNNRLNTAVVPSVKGMNPITGQPIGGPQLESYEEKCPVHGTPFGHNLLCEECGYRWPSQNYLTHESILWLDGFRQPDGTVRQFFFTEDDKRDIASIVMGKENTMPAFGFVFYKPREEREEMMFGGVTINWKDYYSDFYKLGDNNVWHSHCDSTSYNPIIGSNTTTSDGTLVDDQNCTYTCSIDSSMGSVDASVSKPPPIKKSAMSAFRANMLNSKPKKALSRSISKEASIGAGAEIRQDIIRDSLGIDGWREEPSSIIRLYFCFEEQFRHIVETGGVRGVQTKKAGYLDGLPVG